MTGHSDAKATLSWEELPALFPGLSGAGRWLPLLERQAALIAGAGPRVRVSSVPVAEAVRRHYAESLELLRIIRLESSGDTLADVGSGGGFPGLVIAAAEPGLSVHLVEPLQKRARLLQDMAAALGLRNVTVHAQRAEEAGRGSLRDAVSIVTARAVASLPELIEYTAPLAAAGGLLALPKGTGVAAELAAANAALAALDLARHAVVAMRAEVSGTHAVVLLWKMGATPAGFPRRAGVPRRRPL